MKRVSITILLFIVVHTTSMCQTDSSKQFATVSFHCNQSDIKVFDDSLFLGLAPIDTLKIQPGTHIFRYVSLVAGKERSWLYQPVVETLTVRPSEYILRNIEMPAFSHAQLPLSSSSATLLIQKSPDNLTIYLSSGAAVSAGIAAAFFKIRSDNHYADYQLTGDQARLAQVHRLDAAAGIALVACEASLFWLTYTLLSR